MLALSSIRSFCSHYGLFTFEFAVIGRRILFMLFILVFEPATGGGIFAFELSPCICLFNVAGSGMPGVGVGPGFIGLFNVAGSGMPGVGVAPFGTAVALAGIPGVESVEGTIGLAESPGGKLFGSMFTKVLAFRFPLADGSTADPQAKLSPNNAKARTNNNFFDIKINLIEFSVFKMAVPA